MRHTDRILRIWALALMTATAASGCGSPPAPTPIPEPTAVTISCPQPVTSASPLGQPITVVYGQATASSGAPPATVSCTPASATTFPVGTTTVTCTATDARLRAASCTFPITVTAPPRIAFTRFLAFGDSITYGEVGNALNPFVSFYSFDKNYPVILQQLLAGRYTAQSPSVYNAGSPAERAAGPLTLSRFTSLTSSRQFEAVLIMEGSNDIADRDSRAIPPAANALQLMVRDAKSRGMRVLLATIPPEDPTRCNPACRGLAWSVVDPMNAAIRGVAAAEGVALVDVNQALAANVPLYISADGLHPTEIGNAKIAEVFFEVLKTAFDQPPATLTSLFRRR